MPLLIILAVVLVVGTSFALWQLAFKQTGTNVITTGCLKLTLTEKTDAINLTDAVPTSDEEGKKLEPFTFTLENVCTSEADYVVNLETLSTGDKILRDNYVKANLASGENELFIDNLLETHINEEKVIEEATTAYKLHQGKLGNKEKISFNLRLWMDEATEAIDEVMNASWQGKITVTAEYVPPIKNLMLPMDDVEMWSVGAAGLNGNTLYGKYEDIVEVRYENKMNPIDNAERVVDFSVNQDRSILGYYVKDEATEQYTLYIQADGKIMVNPKASYYGYVYSGTRTSSGNWNIKSKVTGIENWDISLVTDMSYMFYANNENDANFNDWDTSKVTNMSRMFYGGEYSGIHGLENIDISHFDTSNVTDMSEMFSKRPELMYLNLGNIDTSKVRDMSRMFFGCNKLTTTINITNPNIENYEYMFWSAATEEGTQITVNYTAETSDLVDRMIATKSENSNVVKGSLIS